MRHPDMRHEQVVYQNPFLPIKIWHLEGVFPEPEERLRKKEQDWRQQKYTEWHYHEEVEFLLILRGELTCFRREEQFVLREGDMAVFGSLEPHMTMMAKEGGVSYLVLQIDLRKYWDSSVIGSMQHFSEVIRPLSSLNYIYRENDAVRHQTAALLYEIDEEMKRSEIGYELAVSARIKTMLLLLLRNDTRKMLTYNDNGLIGRLQPVLDFIERNLGGRLSVSELCVMVNMSYTHFIKTFKKAMGLSFSDFVVFKRIRKAEQLLLTGDSSIAEVAEAVGFSNLGHFYEMFRRYNGCSPKQFKDRLRGPDKRAYDVHRDIFQGEAIGSSL
ncbi:AraC family transcriptional regulator [Gorillibacterium massiliense]|uniref:AraC family transcriptional regulator n=1 Tax=Gorillibacterium massiliense TaxID=1280390 RepID=UPI0004AF656B|nr:AraC family transcriptional regulator [Gorillibacterium massiliense]